jgi:hypothetical protein
MDLRTKVLFGMLVEEIVATREWLNVERVWRKEGSTLQLVLFRWGLQITRIHDHNQKTSPLTHCTAQYTKPVPNRFYLVRNTNAVSKSSNFFGVN